MSSPAGLFFRITLPFAALNIVNQASRTVMTIIGPLLATEFGLSASELGLLAACMFAAYAAVQLPLGVALDLVGPRRVQSTLALVAAAGFALFALSSGLAGFATARIVIGVGISAGLMAILKANAQWFPPSQVANMTGIAMAVGGLGSVLATSPVQAALPQLGWRGVFWLLGGVSLAISAWIWFSVRDKPAAAARRSLGAEFAVMGDILKAPVFWRFAPALVMLAVANFAYLGLWAGPWLRDVAGYDGPLRAQTLFWYTIAMIAGGLAIGRLTPWLHARGIPAVYLPTACIAGLLAAKLGLILQPTNVFAVTLLWMAFAAFAAAGSAGYVALGQMFPAELTGRVSTAANTLTLGGAFLLQTVIGWILDQWPRTSAGGWDPRGYSAALGFSAVLHLVLALGLLRALRNGGASRPST